MEYDSRTGQVVLFGGVTTTGFIDASIWVYDSATNTWTNRNPLPHPSPRVKATLAYDSESDRFVLFGGIADMGTFNETWVYDLNGDAWTLMHPSVSPSSRYWHAMVYDDSVDRIILFGGSSGVGISAVVSDETWAYDLNTNTWTNWNPSPKPTARSAHAMAYDSTAHRTILEGGNSGGETWAYDFASNSWTQLATGPARADPALTYDAQSDRILLFGGVSSPYDVPGGDTWSFEYGSNMWTDMAPSASPPHASGIPMVYDSIADRAVLFPHFHDDVVRAALWSYDFESNAWSWRPPPSHPGFRWSFGLAYDERSAQTILFGGSQGASVSGETWAYDSTTMIWRDTTPASAPSARSNFPMVYASGHDRIVLFGGEERPLVQSGETWLFDVDRNAWSNPNPLTRPPARRSAGLVYDSDADLGVLFGGVSSESPYSRAADTWTYNISSNTWTNVTPTSSPRAREGHSMAYAARSGKAVLFGGFTNDPGEPVGNETWLYDAKANTWTRAMPAVSPPPRSLASMVYDAAVDRIILFGGAPPPDRTCCTVYDDTWSYDVANDTWVHLNSQEHPGGLSSHGLAYDSRTDRIILYGGFFSDETWSFAYAPPVPPGPVSWYSSEVRSSDVRFSWFAPKDTGGAPVESYRIYRGASPGEAAYVGTTNIQEYSEGHLESGVTYYYRVRAVNAAGEGTPSEALQVTTPPTSGIGGRAALLILVPVAAATVTLGTILFFLRRRRRPPDGPSSVIVLDR